MTSMPNGLVRFSQSRLSTFTCAQQIAAANCIANKIEQNFMQVSILGLYQTKSNEYKRIIDGVTAILCKQKKRLYQKCTWQKTIKILFGCVSSVFLSFCFPVVELTPGDELQG
jgi:hypothetical protein